MNTTLPRSTGSVSKRSDKKSVRWTTIKGEKNIEQFGKEKKFKARKRLGGKERTKHAHTITDARRFLRELIDKYEKGGKERLDADRITFAQLAKAYSDHHLKPAVYRDSDDKTELVKDEGCAAWRDGERVMKILVDRFGNRRIRSITSNDIKQWKIDRGNEPKQRGGGRRSNNTVHKDLDFLRQTFNYAVEERWLDRNPCKFAKFIEPKMEASRNRVITIKEERLLLDALNEPDRSRKRRSKYLNQNSFLKAFLIFLLDTGMRIGEASHLQRGDIDLNRGPFGHIYVRRYIAKWKKNRDLPVLTPAVREVIDQRFAVIPTEPTALVFGSYPMRDSFDNAKQDIENLQLRDTRHTLTTRAQRVFPPLEVMKWTGHESLKTHLTYVNPDEDVYDSRFDAYLAAIKARANRS
jgi:integrase